MKNDEFYVISLSHFVNGEIVEHKCFYIDKDDYEFYVDYLETLLELCQTSKTE